MPCACGALTKYKPGFFNNKKFKLITYGTAPAATHTKRTPHHIPMPNTHDDATAAHRSEGKRYPGGPRAHLEGLALFTHVHIPRRARAIN